MRHSTTDIEAAHAAGVPCIGYANRPGKAEALAAAGADAIVTDMSDLAAVLSRTRKPESRLSWIESGGGPLIVVPASALNGWRGAPVDFDPGDLNTWGDYGRACQVDGYADALDVGDDQALVLGDRTGIDHVPAGAALFVRWIYADSEADVIRLIPRAVETADWEDAGTWTTSGPARLFDSALAGDELEHEHPTPLT